MLTKLFRKRVTGQGAVQESNPAIAQREYKAPAQEPRGHTSTGHTIGDRILNYSKDTSEYSGKDHATVNRVYELVKQGEDLHGMKEFSKAHRKFSEAFGATDYNWGEGRNSLSNYIPKYGLGMNMRTHRQDIRAALDNYRGEADKWHAEKSS